MAVDEESEPVDVLVIVDEVDALVVVAQLQIPTLQFVPPHI